MTRDYAWLGFLLPLALTASACESHPSTTRWHPSEQRAELRQYQSCGDLEQDLKEMLINEMEARFEQMREWARGGGYGPPMAGAEDDSGTNGGASDGRQEGVDYSGTNNQEEGVDEADFVKTDGYHVYVLNGNRLHIFGTPEFGDLEPESETPIEGYPRQMLLHKDTHRMVVFSQIDPYSLPEEHPLRQRIGSQDADGYWRWRVSQVSKLTVLDVSDPTAPTLERELFFEGWYQTARLVAGSVHVAEYAWLYVPGVDDYWWGWSTEEELDQAEAEARARIEALDLEDIIPRAYERHPDGGFVVLGFDENTCRSFYRPLDSQGRGFTSILSFDLAAHPMKLDADHVLSNWPTIYASQDRLYVAEPTWSWWWFWWNQDDDEATNIHVFDTSEPGVGRYVGSGRVDGVLHNQFSLGAYQGMLRVATTVNRWNRWWEEDPPLADNRVYVLEEGPAGLDVVGELAGLAPGERIRSARFVGDKGYLVTFQNTDPLFTLDLSDPENPAVVGELEIFGFSSYIHPIADDRLLTIGVGGDENGANWKTQISLFDVSDFAAPALQDVQQLVMGDDWGWSEAMYEHKAFQYWAPQGLLAVPLSSYKYVTGPDGSYDYVYTTRLELVKVDTATGLSYYGSIDHSDFFNSDPDHYWYWRDVRRSIFMGDYLYAISDRGVTVNRTADLSLVTLQPLPGYVPGDYYWWW